MLRTLSCGLQLIGEQRKRGLVMYACMRPNYEDCTRYTNYGKALDIRNMSDPASSALDLFSSICCPVAFVSWLCFVLGLARGSALPFFTILLHVGRA